MKIRNRRIGYTVLVSTVLAMGISLWSPAAGSSTQIQPGEAEYLTEGTAGSVKTGTERETGFQPGETEAEAPSEPVVSVSETVVQEESALMPAESAMEKPASKPEESSAAEPEAKEVSVQTKSSLTFAAQVKSEDKTVSEGQTESGTKEETEAQTEAETEKASEEQTLPEVNGVSETQAESEAMTDQLPDETESITETADVNLEDPTPDPGEEPKEDEAGEGEPEEETEDEGEDIYSVLSDVSIDDDRDGAYYVFSIPENGVTSKLTAWLIDGNGAVVGSGCPLGYVSGSAYRKAYILSFSEGNVFGLSDSDIGRTVRIRITAESDEGQVQDVISDTSVTLRYPSMTMPSVISYTAVSTVGDLMDVNRISGLSFDTGSFSTQRIVERQSDSGWTGLDSGTVFTAADEGLFRIRIATVFGDFYSNEFKVVVPATGLTVSGEQRIGSALNAVVQGPDGNVPKQVSYAWTYAGASAPACTDAVYTTTLQDAVTAQAVSMTVSVTDAIGNVFSEIVTLAPMDLSTQELTAEGYTEIFYDGESQIPYDAKIMLGDYVIPQSLYTLEPAPGKNTVKAGKAWMSVTGNSAYLTGTALVRYRIQKDEEDTEKETPAAKTPESETQPAPAPAPKAEKTLDLTVTDAQGNAAAYQAKMISSQTEGEAQPEQVYEISADPAKKPDGSTLTDESGKPVYQQRHLHVSPALQKTVQERFGRMIRFVLGDGAVQLDLSALESGTAYTVKLAVLENEDLTEDEKNVLSGYGENIGTYAVRIIRDSNGVDVTDSIADTGKLEVLVRTESNEKASILFLKEKREQTQVKPVPYVADGQPVSNEGLTYVKRTAPGSGIFGLLKNQ